MERNRPLKIHFEQNVGSLVSAAYQYDLYHGLYWKNRWREVIAGLVIGLIVGLITGAWWMLAAVPLFLLFVITVTLLVARQIQVRKMIKDPKYRGPFEFTFDEHGLYLKSPGTTGRTDWSYYNGLLEGSRNFLLLYGEHYYMPIPKNAFKSDRQIERFRDLARRRTRLRKAA